MLIVNKWAAVYSLHIAESTAATDVGMHGLLARSQSCYHTGYPLVCVLVDQ